MSKVGRPSKYDPKFCEEVVEFMRQGYSKEATAAQLGINKSTLYEWVEKHEAFSNAVKEGETLSLLFWEKTGMAGMLGKLPGFNATTWIFNMKNRHGWSDRKDVNVGGQEDNPLEVIHNIEITALYDDSTDSDPE